MAEESYEHRQFRLRAQHIAGHTCSKEEVVDDLVDLLKMLGTIEHEQDRDLLDELRKKYGWRW